jgi:hypothetical protein
MSHFYGVIQGNRGDATRGGSKGSGLTAVAASWAGAVEVELFHSETDGRDHFAVRQRKWEGAGVKQDLVAGILGEEVPRARGASSDALTLAYMVQEWAASSVNHGGNPYMLDFVQAAESIIAKA